jgi:hypothetical protein
MQIMWEWIFSALFTQQFLLLLFFILLFFRKIAAIYLWLFFMLQCICHSYLIGIVNLQWLSHKGCLFSMDNANFQLVLFDRVKMWALKGRWNGHLRDMWLSHVCYNVLFAIKIVQGGCSNWNLVEGEILFVHFNLIVIVLVTLGYVERLIFCV